MYTLSWMRMSLGCGSCHTAEVYACDSAAAAELSTQHCLPKWHCTGLHASNRIREPGTVPKESWFNQTWNTHVSSVDWGYFLRIPTVHVEVRLWGNRAYDIVALLCLLESGPAGALLLVRTCRCPASVRTCRCPASGQGGCSCWGSPACGRHGMMLWHGFAFQDQRVPCCVTG